MKVVKIIATKKCFLVEHGVIDFNLTTIGVTYEEMRSLKTQHAVETYTPDECKLYYGDGAWFATINGEEVELINKLECVGSIDANAA